MSATDNSVIAKNAQPFDEETTRRIVEDFNRDGYCFLENVLTLEEVDALREGMKRKWNDPRIQADEAGDHIRGISMMRMYEYDRNFRDLIEREPIVSLAEAILGADCHMMSQNALRYEPGQGGGWHLDDRIPIPCFVINVMIPLSTADSVEYGVTQVIPGSHFAGRNPNDRHNPTFEGRGPVSLVANPGDVYMFHNQVWHCGSRNNSDQVRYVGSVVYSQRMIAQRLYPFIDYRMPDHVWEDASPRLQRLLGRHEKGAYG